MTKFTKYTPYPQVGITSRTWPDKTIKSNPIWCPVDLRDGNQALAEPMDAERKMKIGTRSSRSSRPTHKASVCMYFSTWTHRLGYMVHVQHFPTFL